MKIAIYSRKSKFTGKGDSIGNQIELCKDYAERYFDDIEEYYIYEDEGFSGGDTNRPKFQELMRDAQNKKFDVLICYRLDRVSRNVADFSATIEKLERLDVDFISIKEQFDTSTPMGRAMMHIASVFAQLERETISERIKDNMMQLATTGRWMGGVGPVGFVTERVDYEDQEGLDRSYTRLKEVPEELEVVEYLYDKYLELGSIYKIRKHLINNDIKTIDGNDYSSSTLLRILKNPVYVKADNNVWKHLEEKDMNVLGKDRLNGRRGMITYNKTADTGNKTRDKSQWIVSVAEHEGYISAKKWLAVQNRLKSNSRGFPRTGTSNQALLSGLVRCANCGAAMNINYGSKRKDGSVAHYYVCSKKVVSGRQLCSAKNIIGIDADLTVMSKISEMAKSKEVLLKKFKSIAKDSEDFGVDAAIKDLSKKEELLLQEINNLVTELSKSDVAAKYIVPNIETKDKELNEIRSKMLKIKEDNSKDSQANMNIDLLTSNIEELAKKADSLDQVQKKIYLQTIVESIVWDGDSETLHLNLFGSDIDSYQFRSPSSSVGNRTTMTVTSKIDYTLKFMDMKEDSLGARVRKHRLLNQYTNKELGDMVGLTRTSISSIQSDDRSLSKGNLKKIAAALGVSVSYLKNGQ